MICYRRIGVGYFSTEVIRENRAIMVSESLSF